MNDQQQCPLCGASNQCGRISADTGTCWCFSTPIASSVLARIPESAQGQTCICPDCARREQVPQENPAQQHG